MKLPSIRVSLLKWLVVPLLSVNIIGAGVTYWLAWIPAQIAFDQSLADAGWAMIPRLHENGSQVEIDLSKQAEQVLRVDHFDAIFLVVRDQQGKLLAGDADFPALPEREALNEPAPYDGFMRGEPVRIMALKTLVGKQTVHIGVAETLRKRTHIRSVIFLALLLLEGVLALALIAVIWLAISKGLLPLKRMREELNARSRDDLSALDEKPVPSELVPVVKAINGLLERVQLDAKAQQNFLANVAHQLRTPLAGFRTQLEWLLHKHADEPESAHSIVLMTSSTERMIRQTNQLLTLARAEPAKFEKERLRVVEMNQLVEGSVQHFVEEAHKKHIDLGFNLQPTRVMGDHFLLRDLIDNLIDNAIRYSPRNGRVTVSTLQGKDGGIFSVEDSGPGIAPSEQESIFKRSHRLDDSVAGNGLGLAIVRDIAKDHGARITLEPGAAGGTIFSVHFPFPILGAPSKLPA
ncbi:sensor histidine kinase [Collimonas pratensis]|uniref:histidine kinase n=1 Tax=Collimonas pratensis TaxID=279113 RepID=A0ABM5Z9A2_9BURK|nr:sensor histidine kinase [Collimonas pratensis]AMP15629.1 HAMP domain protein [Collimonas pratensis]NKI69966.1 sensor histidine kinase [Collimonas pratensis]